MGLGQSVSPRSRYRPSGGAAGREAARAARPPGSGPRSPQGGAVKHQVRNSEFSLSPRELRRLLDGAADMRDRLVVQIFVYTGLRRAELRQLRWADVDLRRQRLLVRQGKGGKQRIVYLPEATIHELAAFQVAGPAESPFVFPGRRGRPLSLRAINYIVERVARSAGVATPNPRYRNVGPHLLRHSFARNWKRAGGSLESLQKMLGHSSLKTTLDVYGTEGQDETEENYRSLARMLVSAPPSTAQS